MILDNEHIKNSTFEEEKEYRKRIGMAEGDAWKSRKIASSAEVTHLLRLRSPHLNFQPSSSGQFSCLLDLGPLGDWKKDGDYFKDILDAGNR